MAIGVGPGEGTHQVRGITVGRDVVEPTAAQENQQQSTQDHNIHYHCFSKKVCVYVLYPARVNKYVAARSTTTAQARRPVYPLTYVALVAAARPSPSCGGQGLLSCTRPREALSRCHRGNGHWRGVGTEGGQSMCVRTYMQHPISPEYDIRGTHAIQQNTQRANTFTTMSGYASTHA